MVLDMTGEGVISNIKNPCANSPGNRKLHWDFLCEKIEIIYIRHLYTVTLHILVDVRKWPVFGRVTVDLTGIPSSYLHKQGLT